MAVALVTGSGGLVGSDSVRYLVEAGWDVVGLENDMRASFFGPDASTNHRWWISDLAEFTADYPEWGLTHDVESILSEIHDANLHRWSAARA